MYRLVQSRENRDLLINDRYVCIIMISKASVFRLAMKFNYSASTYYKTMFKLFHNVLNCDNTKARNKHSRNLVLNVAFSSSISPYS